MILLILISYHEVNVSKRKLKRKEERYEYNKKLLETVNNNKIKVEYLDNGISEKTNEIKVENIRQSKGLKFNKKIKLFN